MEQEITIEDYDLIAKGLIETVGNSDKKVILDHLIMHSRTKEPLAKLTIEPLAKLTKVSTVTVHRYMDSLVKFNLAWQERKVGYKKRYKIFKTNIRSYSVTISDSEIHYRIVMKGHIIEK